jgi:hypothetical protein
MIAGEVEPPGDAPNNADTERSSETTTSVPSFSTPPLSENVLDDLHTLASLPQTPIFVLCLGHVAAQRCHFVLPGQLQLLREIFYECKLMGADLKLRNDIGGRGCLRDIEIRSILEEFGGPGGEWPEQQHSFTIQHAGIQMRHRHRWRTRIRQAVHLGQMARGNCRIIRDQELAAYREASILFRFRNARQL